MIFFKNMQKIFAIVVTNNGKKRYDRCLGSLRELETPVEIIVKDNASSDGTVEYLKTHFILTRLNIVMTICLR